MVEILKEKRKRIGADKFEKSKNKKMDDEFGE